MDNTYVEEAVEARRARLKQMDKDESDARSKQLEAAAALTEGHNERYFAEQDKLFAQIKDNKPRVLPGPTAEELGARVQEKYLYAPFDSTAPDVLMERESAITQRNAGYVPFKPKPSIVGRPQGKNDPLKRAMPEMAEIMDRPVTVVGLSVRTELKRPTMPCPNRCGCEVSTAAAYHHLPNGEACVLPGGEAIARQEGIVLKRNQSTAPLLKQGVSASGESEEALKKKLK